MALTQKQLEVLEYLDALTNRGKIAATGKGLTEELYGDDRDWHGPVQTLSSLSRRGLVQRWREPRTGMVYSITVAGRHSLKAHKEKKT